MNRYVVVDASVAAKWLLVEDGSDEARRLSDRWASEGVQVAAPRLLRYEITNVLFQQIRRRNLSLDLALKLFADLLDYEIEYVDSVSIHLDAMNLAVQLDIRASYDAHYLALAEQLDCECWTADRALARATSGLGERVRLLTPA